MKNQILELFKAYERETEWEGSAIPESMYSALANDIMKLYSQTKRIGSIRYGGLQGIICGIDEARTVIIAHEHMVRYPTLPGMKEADDQDRYLECLKATLSLGEFRKQYLNEPEIPVEFQNLSIQASIAAEDIKSLAIELKAYDDKIKTEKRHKGHERPYKYHK